MFLKLVEEGSSWWRGQGGQRGLICYEVTGSYWDPKYCNGGREENLQKLEVPQIPERELKVERRPDKSNLGKTLTTGQFY